MFNSWTNKDYLDQTQVQRYEIIRFVSFLSIEPYLSVPFQFRRTDRSGRLTESGQSTQILTVLMVPEDIALILEPYACRLADLVLVDVRLKANGPSNLGGDDRNNFEIVFL